MAGLMTPEDEMDRVRVGNYLPPQPPIDHPDTRSRYRSRLGEVRLYTVTAVTSTERWQTPEGTAWANEEVIICQ